MKITKNVVCAVALIVLSVGVWKAAEHERKTAATSVTIHMPSTAEVTSVGTLPTGPQGNIMSFLESGLYEPWKTLNTSAQRLFFLGTDLVSIEESYLGPDFKPLLNPFITVTTRSAVDRTQPVHRFQVPTIGTRQDNFFSRQAGDGYAWNTQGQLAVMNANRQSIDILDAKTGKVTTTVTSSLFELKAFDERSTVLGLTANKLLVRITEAVIQAGNLQIIPKVKVLDLRTNGIVTLDQSERMTRRAKYTFNESSLLVGILERGESPDKTELIWWDLETGTIKELRGVLREFSNNTLVFEVLFSPDGTLLAVSFKHGRVVKMVLLRADTETLPPLHVFEGRDNYYVLGFSPDNALCITTSVLSHVACVYDTLSGTLLQRLNNVDVLCAAFGLNNTMIALSGATNVISVWKKSTALQDSLYKSERVQQMRQEAALRAQSASRAAANIEEESQTDTSSVD